MLSHLDGNIPHIITQRYYMEIMCGAVISLCDFLSPYIRLTKCLWLNYSNFHIYTPFAYIKVNDVIRCQLCSLLQLNCHDWLQTRMTIMFKRYALLAITHFKNCPKLLDSCMSIDEYRDNMFLKSHSIPCSDKDWSTRVCYRENADKYNAAGSLLQYEVIISHESGTIVAMTTCHLTHDVCNSESSTIYRLEH